MALPELKIVQAPLIGAPRVALPVDPLREYVSTGGFGINPEVRALSPAADDITRQLSSSIYSQMLCDPKLTKCVNILVNGTLGEGWELLPSVKERARPTPEEKERYERAVEIRDFTFRSLDNLDKTLTDTLEDLLRGALSYGHKVAELVWMIPDAGEDKDKLVLRAIKVKPRETCRFVVDRYLNVLGIIASNAFDRSSLGGMSIDAGSIIPLAAMRLDVTASGAMSLNGAEVFPRDKFAVLTLRGLDEDPRGQSFLRPAFNSWHLKREGHPQYLRFILHTAKPYLIGYTPEGEGKKELLRDLEGNYIADSEGRYVEVSPVEYLASELLKLLDNGVMACKGGSEVDFIEATGDGSAFLKYFEYYDQQMEESLLLQTLATSDSKFNTRAASQTHMTVLDQAVFRLKNSMAEMLSRDVLSKIVRYNFGEEDALDFTPIIHFGDTERREFAKDGQTIAAMMRAGFLHPSQFKALDAQLGIPPRDISEAELEDLMTPLLTPVIPGAGGAGTQLPNGSVSNPAPRRAKFPAPGRVPAAN